MTAHEHAVAHESYVAVHDHPGVIFRGPAHDRRAALAAGPDVWEVVARLQELEGSEEHRISLLAAESDIHPRLIRIALDYATEHADEIRERIDRNRGRGGPEGSC